jgi:hypothetical protein
MRKLRARYFLVMFATISLRNLLSSRLLPKNVRIKTHNYNFACSFVWTWSLTLKEEHRLRVFENRVLRGIFQPERDEVKRY